MRFTFRPQLADEVKSYAAHTPQGEQDILDCSLGVNPYGAPSAATAAIREFDLSTLDKYPHSKAMEEAVTAYWRGCAALEREEVTLTDSSMGALYSLHNIFAQSVRSEAVGFVPSFTDALVSIRHFGLGFRGVPLLAERSGRADVRALSAAITEKTAFVYLDRPNNPTGQTLPLADVAYLLDAAREAGAYVLVDEAYGDFLPREESALTLFDRYDNLLVCRTMSKGFGMANLRAGYTVTPPEIAGYLRRTSHPYLLSDLVRVSCARVLREEPNFSTSHSGDIADAKEMVRRCIGGRIHMLETDPRVPICTLFLQAGGDLQSLLLRENVLSVSGCEFEGLDARYVRLCVPTLAQMPRLIQALEGVEGAGQI